MINLLLIETIDIISISLSSIVLIFCGNWLFYKTKK